MHAGASEEPRTRQAPAVNGEWEPDRQRRYESNLYERCSTDLIADAEVRGTCNCQIGAAAWEEGEKVVESPRRSDYNGWRWFLEKAVER